DHQSDRGKVASHGKTRADGILVDQKLIVVPAKSRADRPIAETNEVLHVNGLLKVGTVSSEGEGLGRPRIELAGIGKDIAEVFVQEHRVGFDTCLELLPS